MDQDLKQLAEENNKLLLENLELSRQNSKKIKKIHAYMRRTFVAKITYWIIIILVAVGAFYFVQPHINRALEGYKNIQEQLTKTSGYLAKPASLLPTDLSSEDLLGDIDLIQKLFGGDNSTQ